MMIRLFIILLMLSIGLPKGIAQKKDPVLFTVEGNPVHVSEFKYIYAKTNGQKADYSRESVEEYLNLYTKFKLKVQRAKDMQLDTIPALIRELAGYRKQLADSYLVDKEVTERLVKEAYDRSRKDVDISHIMVGLKANPTPADTLAAYNKIQSAIKLMDQGKTFEEVAAILSEDRATNKQGGRLGFVTAMLPDGFYALESAAYKLRAGQVSEPVRSRAGYHLVKVNGERPARGEMEAAHILIRVDKRGANNAASKAKIDSLYKQLRAGADFATLARAHSQDKASAAKGGSIGYFGINRYERNFEDAAFALKKDGDISEPVKTSVGWHIIKRTNRKALEPYDLTKRRLQPKVQRDSRYQLAKQAMVKRIKKENHYTLHRGVLAAFIDSLDPDFLSPKWRPSPDIDKDALFTLGGTTNYTVDQLEAYCQRAARTRLRAGKNTDPKVIGRKLFEEFVDESCIKFEENNLEKKYPEFKSLMREYEEGILLFEATKNLVWDKASQDSAGLAQFHALHRNDYMWGERAAIKAFTVKKEGAGQIDKIRKCAKKESAEKVLEKFNKKNKIVAVQDQLEEKPAGDRKKDHVLASMDWKAGAMSKTTTNEKNGSLKFLKIEKIMPPAQKTLSEARGFIIANYQDHLEKKWIAELMKSYTVKINQRVLDSLIK